MKLTGRWLRHSRRRFRAQLFSLDLLIAVAVFTFSIGAALQLHEAAAKNLAVVSTGSNAAETIAEALESNQSLNYTPPYCARYSNGTENCAGFSCAGNVFAARKIMNCTSGTCLLEVRACG